MKKTKAILKIQPPQNDDVFNAESLRRQISDDYIYDSDNIQISVLKDGSLSLFADSSESHVFFYPDTLAHVAKAVRIARKQAKEAKKAQ